jgi:succinate dehydrogenase/fumarate reductase flavoprotein subunit
LRASIELAQRGVQVLAVGKRRKHDAHTTLAAGGINAALGTMDPEDTGSSTPPTPCASPTFWPTRASSRP